MIKKPPLHKKQETALSGFSYMMVLSTLLVVILALLFLEYAYQIPSKFLASKETVKITVTQQVITGTTDEPKPFACTMEYAPVCGSDAATYSNACMARAVGVTITHDGTCEGGVSSTGLQIDSLIEVAPSVPKTSENIGPSLPKDPAPIDPSDEFQGYVTPQVYDTGAYLIYTNTSLGYEIALPKYVYYQGFGARDGAAHSLAISLTSSGVDAFDTSDVRVYYYRGQAPADVRAGATKIDTTSGTIIVDAGNSTDPKIQKIVDTIRMSAK